MSDTTLAASSQAEEAAISTPQAGEETTTATTETQATAESPEVARLRAELEKVRKEAAGNRVKLREFEQAQMSESDRQKARLAELEEERNTLFAKARQKSLEATVTTIAVKAGVKPDLAMRLVRADEVEWNDDGEPKNVTSLLNGLLKEHPELRAQAAASSANPGRGATDTGNPEADLAKLLYGDGSSVFEATAGGGVKWAAPESKAW